MPKQPRTPAAPFESLAPGNIAVELTHPPRLWVGRSNIPTGPMFTFGQQWEEIESGGGGGNLQLAYIVNTIGDLPATGQTGELAVVLTPTPSQGYVWDGSTWQPVGPLTAVAGPPGPQGPAGASGLFTAPPATPTGGDLLTTAAGHLFIYRVPPGTWVQIG